MTASTFIVIAQFYASSIAHEAITVQANSAEALKAQTKRDSTIALSTYDNAGMAILQYDPEWLRWASNPEAILVAAHEACHFALHGDFLRHGRGQPSTPRMETQAKACASKWTGLESGRIR